MKTKIDSKIDYLVVLTGAGVSAESGIKTFRDSNGLWENHRIEEVACPMAFEQNPELVQSFYNLRREQLKEVTPNQAHLSLAEIERRMNGRFCLITQNVDDLHERAGNKNIIHMHGELRKLRSTLTEETKYFEDSLTEDEYLEWRPDIVWFGEDIKNSKKIYSELSKATCFISIGTSGQVYPAAGLVEICKTNGAHTIETNLEETPHIFEETHLGEASKLVPYLLQHIF